MNTDQLAARLARNPRTPLFARLASNRLDAGLTEEALALCEAGLAEYPKYATARLIAAKCHADLREYRKALDELQKAQDTACAPGVFSELRAQWGEILREQEDAALRESTYTPPFRRKTTLDFFQPRRSAEPSPAPAKTESAPEPVETVDRADSAEPAENAPTLEVERALEIVGPEEPLQSVIDAVNDILAGDSPVDLPLAAESSQHFESPQSIETPMQSREASAVEPAQVEEDSARLAGELPGIVDAVTETPVVAFSGETEVRESIVPPVVVPAAPVETGLVTVTTIEDLPAGVSDEGRIVSRTLAEIYAAQGAYGEAILTYRLLRRVRPDLVPQIDRRIGELEGLSGGR